MYILVIYTCVYMCVYEYLCIDVSIAYFFLVCVCVYIFHSLIHMQVCSYIQSVKCSFRTLIKLNYCIVRQHQGGMYSSKQNLRRGIKKKFRVIIICLIRIYTVLIRYQ